MCFWAKKALPLFDGKYELWNKICKWLSDLTDWVCAQQVVKFQVWSLHEGQSTLASPDLGFKAKLSLNWNTGLASKCSLVIFKQSFIQGFFNFWEKFRNENIQFSEKEMNSREPQASLNLMFAFSIRLAICWSVKHVSGLHKRTQHVYVS